ncbi:MAG: hypothetical protein KJ970_10185 [Candidatus Eisenbacteria bacterium]|uniref:Cache domain-containing protein n=1 Tax=Eiseniibacteriota bacterium TaxID=2212470 RepID=A0A948RXD3_UNCEI|nr:hypothetical protein [Candidatus Eisenbacteria bacterium]MBU1948397.1 hypothetical protein [Candidatus Eisenbacteria bacterium]MBU2691288.1 hypothetical protein [Candidatus Eisenbacteria bacterium]
MNALEILEYQLERSAASLTSRILKIYDVLEELRDKTLRCFRDTKNDRRSISQWLREEAFAEDPDGFFQSLAALEKYRNGQADPDGISYFWNPQGQNDPQTRFRMYALRDFGTILTAVRKTLPGIAWVYYQDVTNASIQHPYIDLAAAISPDFDWSQYHTYLSVSPKHNPGRAIRWTAPTVDYAGEGIILSVSIPVYEKDNFLGLWSIDVPLEFLQDRPLVEVQFPGSDILLVDDSGNIISHNSIVAEINKEKGSILYKTIDSLSSDFDRPDFMTSVLRKKQGRMIVKMSDGRECYAHFQSLPQIGWVLFSIVPLKKLE